MTPTFLRVHRTLLTVFAGLVVVGGGGGALAALHTTPPPRHAPTAQQSGPPSTTPVPTATPDQATPAASEATTATPAPSNVSSIRGGGSPGPVQVTSATPYPTKPPGMPRCQDADFVLRLKPEQSSYSISSGQRVIFDITLTYQGTVECNGYLGSGWPTLHIFNAQGQLVFSDACTGACGSFPPYNPVSPGRQVVNTTEWWDDKECSTSKCWDCRYDCPPRPPVPPGTYTVYVSDDPYKQSPTVSFQLTP
jgi:hypothetical protein